MFLAWKKAQVLDASILALVASLVALAPPTPQMASSTARTPMYTPTHLLRSSLSPDRRSMTSSMDIGHLLALASVVTIRACSSDIARASFRSRDAGRA